MLSLDKIALSVFLSTATADEVSTAAAQRKGVSEVGPFRDTRVRLASKVAVGYLYMKLEKRSKFLRFFIPIVYTLETAHTIHEMQKRR